MAVILSRPQCVMAKWRIYASLIYVTVGLDYSVQCLRRQAIIQTNGNSLLNRRFVSSSELAQEPLQSSRRKYQSNETSTDIIKDSKFEDHLYIDWHAVKQQYASKANAVGLPYRD